MKWYRVSLLGWVVVSLYVWSIGFSIVFSDLVYTEESTIYINALFALMFLFSSYAFIYKVRIFAAEKETNYYRNRLK